MTVPNKCCPECGAAFVCEYELGKNPCWCSTKHPPIVPMADAARGCLCPACLEKRVAQQAMARVGLT
ncbi:MAG: cysteine-rich CWC family protein [Betaproteobacteria bacterium]|nr:cysteine-rich CWC family protein [Betaproteobacteria bacterium]